MKTRIIVIVGITLLLSTLTIINIPRKDSDKEIQECLNNNNYSFKVDKGNVECNMTTTAETTTTTTTTKKTTKKTTTASKIKIPENEITTYIYKKIKEEGWGDSEYNAIVNIAIKESSLNPNSVNKTSGACGLFQAYPCKKAIKQYPDYMTNYKSQVNWGINYIKDRYKTPSNAWKFWQEHKWY